MVKMVNSEWKSGIPAPHALAQATPLPDRSANQRYESTLLSAAVELPNRKCKTIPNPIHSRITKRRNGNCLSKRK